MVVIKEIKKKGWLASHLISSLEHEIMQVNVVEEREQKFKEISLKTKGDMRQTFWRKKHIWKKWKRLESTAT